MLVFFIKSITFCVISIFDFTSIYSLYFSYIANISGYLGFIIIILSNE